MTAMDLTREFAALGARARGAARFFGSNHGLTIPGAVQTSWETSTGGESLASIANGALDNVIGLFALEQTKDPYAALREWRRVLREGGSLTLVLRAPDGANATAAAHSFTPGYFVQLVNAVGGFQITMLEEVNVGVSWVVSAERRQLADIRMPLGSCGPEVAQAARCGHDAKAELYFQFGAILLQADEAAFAQQCFQRALQLDPKACESLFGLGMSLSMQGQWPDAVTSLQKVVALTPQNAEAKHWLTLARKQCSEPVAAT